MKSGAKKKEWKEKKQHRGVTTFTVIFVLSHTWRKSLCFLLKPWRPDLCMKKAARCEYDQENVTSREVAWSLSDDGWVRRINMKQTALLSLPRREITSNLKRRRGFHQLFDKRSPVAQFHRGSSKLILWFILGASFLEPCCNKSQDVRRSEIHVLHINMFVLCAQTAHTVQTHSEHIHIGGLQI